MTLTIKLDGNWNSFQLANSAPPLSVTDSAIAPSARINKNFVKLVGGKTMTLLVHFRLHASSRDLVMAMTRSGCQHCAAEFGNMFIIIIMITIHRYDLSPCG